MLTFIQRAWEVYNAEGSWLPFMLPFFLWGAAFLYSTIANSSVSFHEWNLIHNIHNGVAILLGIVSLALQDDAYFRERVQVFWNISYFMVDFADCLLRRDKVYTFHAMATLVGGYYHITSPTLMEVRVASRFSFLELSNPLRYLAVKTKKPLHSILFFLVFTLVRVVYIPFVMKRLLNAGLVWTDGPMLVCVTVYSLQLWWWLKMWRIIIKMARGKDVGHEIKEE